MSVSAGEIVRPSKHGLCLYRNTKYLIVGDIFWNGSRRLLGIDIYRPDDKHTELSESLVEVCNED